MWCAFVAMYIKDPEKFMTLSYMYLTWLNLKEWMDPESRQCSLSVING